MILFALIFVTIIRDIQMQPATCIDDIHCTVGFFCHPLTYLCHECLSCESLRRSPAFEDSGCIKSGDQCGPCLQGFVTYEAKWGAMCLPPEAKNIRILTSYMFILATAGVLISMVIVHGIWNTQLIKVKIAIPTRKNSPEQAETDMVFLKQYPTGFTA